jgi:hypothetical protein
VQVGRHPGGRFDLAPECLAHGQHGRAGGVEYQLALVVEVEASSSASFAAGRW